MGGILGPTCLLLVAAFILMAAQALPEHGDRHPGLQAAISFLWAAAAVISAALAVIHW
jgi:hypothetical protein